MTSRHSTEKLVRQLSQQPAPSGFRAGPTALAMLAVVLAGLGVFVLVFGFRADLASALSQPAILAKSVLPLAAAALTLPLALASARPDARPALWPLILPAALALALLLIRLVQVSPGAVIPELLGQTAAACLISITALSLGPLVVGLSFMKRGATTRPMLSGALTGLAAGAAAAAGYALHCTEDSPLFFVVWYGLAIMFAGLIGALAGRRLLRW